MIEKALSWNGSLALGNDQGLDQSQGTVQTFAVLLYLVVGSDSQ